LKTQLSDCEATLPLPMLIIPRRLACRREWGELSGKTTSLQVFQNETYPVSRTL